MQCRSVIIIIISAFIFGCGGGSSDDVTPVNASVNAGSDISVIERTSLTLTAIGSPEGGTFTWQQISGPEVSSFPQEGAEVTFLAPNIKSDSVFVFKVDYQTSADTIVSDKVTLTVLSNNLLPTAVINKIAPDNNPIKYQDTVVLSAELSVDADENGFISEYKWQQVSGPALTFSSTKLSTLTFIHPLLANDENAKFTLNVTDDEGGSASTEYQLALFKNDKLVIASAGDDKKVKEFDTVTLDASKSASVDGVYNCFWQQLAGSQVLTQVVLSNPNACLTEFIAPDVDFLKSVTFSLTVTDANTRTDTDDINIEISPKAVGLMNDTGVSKCYNNTEIINCGEGEFPNQDADIGRDSVANYIDKTGRGRQAFDFTKLSELSDELPDDAVDFRCVRDNVTGLIWEVKAPASNSIPGVLHQEAHHHYTWYVAPVSADPLRGSVAGPKDSTCLSGNKVEHCGLQTLVTEMNDQQVCNGSNWRLPTYNELMSIMEFGREDGDLLDPSFFPNTPSHDLLGHLYYWTYQTNIEGQTESKAFVLDMKTGNDIAYPKEETAYIRLVRTP